jgi:hypothetical protein
MTPADLRALSLHEYGAFRDYMIEWINAQQRARRG